MPKYRDLTTDELQSLEPEFIKFLAINGIAADDWAKWLENDSSKVNGILSAFSDVVFEKILRQAQYLEHKVADHWYAFHCQAKQIVLIGLSTEDKSINFTSVDQFAALADQDLKIFTQTKPYGKPRELELFDMIQRGATISDGQSYKQMALALKKSD